MRDVYVGQLEKLNQEMIEIGNFCERALREASESLVKGDTALAKQVLTYEAALDEREYVIEALCNRLLLLQQPVAGDLRIITASSKMLTNLVRIGMQAVDICETMLRKEINQKPVEVDHLAELAVAVERMIHDVMQAFAEKNTQAAHDVIEYDEVVDEFFYKTKHNIAGLLKTAETREETDYALDLLMIDKYYERMGDHCVKIAQQVLYAFSDKINK